MVATAVVVVIDSLIVDVVVYSSLPDIWSLSSINSLSCRRCHCHHLIYNRCNCRRSVSCCPVSVVLRADVIVAVVSAAATVTTVNQEQCYLWQKTIDRSDLLPDAMCFILLYLLTILLSIS